MVFKIKHFLKGIDYFFNVWRYRLQSIILKGVKQEEKRR